MTKNTQAANLTMHIVPDNDSDQEEMQKLSYQLYDEIVELDVESAEFVPEHETPEGAKGISISPEIAISVFVPVIIEVFKTGYLWLKRREDRKIKVKSIIGDQEFELLITSKGYQSDEVEKFIDMMNKSFSTASHNELPSG